MHHFTCRSKSRFCDAFSPSLAWHLFPPPLRQLRPKDLETSLCWRGKGYSPSAFPLASFSSLVLSLPATQEGARHIQNSGSIYLEGDVSALSKMKRSENDDEIKAPQLGHFLATMRTAEGTSPSSCRGRSMSASEKARLGKPLSNCTGSWPPPGSSPRWSST